MNVGDDVGVAEGEVVRVFVGERDDEGEFVAVPDCELEGERVCVDDGDCDCDGVDVDVSVGVLEAEVVGVADGE